MRHECDGFSRAYFCRWRILTIVVVVMSLGAVEQVLAERLLPEAGPLDVELGIVMLQGQEARSILPSTDFFRELSQLVTEISMCQLSDTLMPWSSTSNARFLDCESLTAIGSPRHDPSKKFQRSFRVGLIMDGSFAHVSHVLVWPNGATSEPWTEGGGLGTFVSRLAALGYEVLPSQKPPKQPISDLLGEAIVMLDLGCAWPIVGRHCLLRHVEPSHAGPGSGPTTVERNCWVLTGRNCESENASPEFVLVYNDDRGMWSRLFR